MINLSNSFFAMHSRMKYINRWALMRNTQIENISEHSNDVAAIAHAIAVIKNLRFGGNVNAEKAAIIGLYHDMPEIITGDMPTPVKYHSETLHNAFLKVEDEVCNSLISMLPGDMREYYNDYFFSRKEDEYLWKIVKAADKISALIKCIEEKKAGNSEFDQALVSTEESIRKMNMPEVDSFMNDFIPDFWLSLDEQSKNSN